MNKILTFSKSFPLISLFVVFLITAFFTLQIPNLKIDSSVKNLLSMHDPDKEFYDKTIDLFGSDKVTSIVITDHNLFSLNKLEILEQLFFKLEELPEVQRVDSLFNISNFHNNEGILHTLPMLDPIPETQEEIEKIKSITLKNPLLAGQLISSDAKSMVLNVYTLEKDDNLEFNETLTKNIDNLIKPLSTQFLEIYQIGPASMATEVAKNIEGDQIKSIPVVILVITILLLIFFKSFSAALVPFISGTTTLLCILGYAAIADIPMQMLTIAIPCILFIMGSTEDTHIVAEFLEGKHLGHNTENAIKYMARKVTVPILLTTLTTFIGFATILTNDIFILREFAHLASVGIIINFLLTITVGPAVLTLLNQSERSHEVKPENEKSKFFHFLVKLFYKCSIDFKGTTTLVLLFLIFLFAIQLDKVKTENNSIAMLREKSPTRISVNKLNQNFGGIFTIFARFTHPEKDGFRDKENLKILLKVHKLVDKIDEIKTAQSLPAQLALINREMNDQAKGEFEIPQSDSLLSQYLLFLSHDDKKNYVNPDFNEVNIVFRHQVSSSHKSLELVSKIENEIREILKDSNISFRITGENLRIDKATHSLIDSQISSISLIILCVFIVVWALFFDIKIAFISLIPNLFPILGLFGLMGYLGIPIDIGTCSIAAVSIGIAVDDTIHFFSRFNQNMKIYYDPKQAINRTIEEEIKPIFSTSLAISLGLSIFAFSSFIPLIKFGTLMAYVIILAMISDLIITPLILYSIKPKGFVSLVDILEFDIEENVYKESDLFADIPGFVAKQIILSGKIEDFPKDEFIGPKQLSKNLYLVLEGECVAVKSAQRKYDNDNEIELAHFSPGYVFGSVQTEDFNGYPIECRVDLITPCKILVINPKFIEEIKNFSPIIEQEIIKNINHILNTSEIN